MSSKYSVSLEKVVTDNSFEVLFTPKDIGEVYISSTEVNRPGLIFTGFTDYFDADRIQFLGLAEIEYLSTLGQEKKDKSLERLFKKKPSAVIITRSLDCGDKILDFASEYKVPLLRTSETTSSSMASLIAYLSVELADRITRHGVLVEVSGEGVLILGGSGVGKSETALELIKRGHRLIADDAVEIRRVSAKTLVGSAPDNIRHFIELRGVGVINARQIFGMGAVKLTEKIDMVVQLEPWEDNKVYDRLGIDNEYANILGIEVPMVVVPVKPGRNLSIIVEAAAMNNRQKKMGYNAALELLKNLGISDDIVSEKKELETIDSF
ncbi:MAG: HPr(Ser) kinase/phosphatase [Clostridiales bacterium]|nr:HPr(Ser) kinase/phosphatase [Clostridiales bacterium]